MTTTKRDFQADANVAIAIATGTSPAPTTSHDFRHDAAVAVAIATGPAATVSAMLTEKQYRETPAHQVPTVTSHIPGAAWHDYMLTLNGPPMRLWVDDSEVGSEIDLQDMPSAPSPRKNRSWDLVSDRVRIVEVARDQNAAVGAGARVTDAHSPV